MDLKMAVVDLMPGPLVRTFASPYIAGKGMEAGIRKADQIFRDAGLRSTVDLLGEAVHRREDVEATVQLYFRMIEALKGKHHASISLKPTQLGIHESEGTCAENIRKIVARAAPQGTQVTIDMEDRHFTDLTLRIFKALRADFDNVGIVLQSRLFRCREDILALPKLPCKVRICIGIYNEPPEVALTDKGAMKEKMFEFVQLLLDLGHYPEIATHDEALIRRCMGYLEARGCPNDAFEYQMLLGVPRTALQQEIVAKGQVMRLYVPFAEEWKYAIHYLKRRLAHNPMMAAYVLGNLFRT
ncbi:MAG: proline dehydrogenase family protein [Acidobacteria bacterium]|nr:proline dehydrogenase family protein [Acidobacteriota bacterium]